ncbi:MAG: UvrD-helicase domain-containing protein [Lachnospiraceae bacterium]|nr:UvrD-helicase domain-containing protein [Lachnospiraceae bacterium]
MDQSITDSINRMLINSIPKVPEKPITLSDTQRAIVESDANRIIVAAGAGSGKTRVLIERIKYLLTSRKVDPSNIVAITFTNMAADEMRERLANVPGVGDAFIGTIHSFANRIFQSSGRSYSIYSDEKDSELHRELINKYCKYLSYDKYLLFKDLKAKVDIGLVDDSKLRDFLLPSERSELSRLHKPAAEAAKDPEFPESIDTLCRQRNIITFDELLKKATEYFRSIGAEIEYVLVDEFQDVGSLEYKFIKSLNAKNYFFVGDDWQAIYAFKGGNVHIFKSLMADKRYTKFYLTDNYRSGSEIIKVGTQVIEQVPDRIEKDVVVKSGRTGKVVIDSRYKIDDYLNTIKQHGKYGDWFILLRTNREVYQMTERLSRLRIPFSTFKRADMSLAELRYEMLKDTVKVLTIHTSKGLEAPNVLIHGRFPLNVPAYQKNSDERKVFYVGITRAESQLFILN